MNNKAVLLCAALLLSACSSQESTISAQQTCAVVDIQVIASRSSEVAAAKQKIAQQLKPKRDRIRATIEKKQQLESRLHSEPALSKSSKRGLASELATLDKVLFRQKSELEKDLKAATSSYNRYLLSYLVQHISAKASLDGIDVIYNEHNNTIINRSRGAEINCSSNVENYTDKIINVINR
ncbi:MAG: OmpH family outer membrane protein [Candidatus Thiodiazotropha sp.]